MAENTGQLNVYGEITRVRGAGARVCHFTTGEQPDGIAYTGWRQAGVFLAGTYIRFENGPHCAERYVWQYIRQEHAPVEPDTRWIDLHRPQGEML